MLIFLCTACVPPQRETIDGLDSGGQDKQTDNTPSENKTEEMKDKAHPHIGMERTYRSRSDAPEMRWGVDI